MHLNLIKSMRNPALRENIDFVLCFRFFEEMAEWDQHSLRDRLQAGGQLGTSPKVHECSIIVTGMCVVNLGQIKVRVTLKLALTDSSGSDLLSLIGH